MSDGQAPTPVEYTQLRQAEPLTAWLEEFRIPLLWRFSRGRGVKVAVLDSGIDSQHEDLQGAVEAQVNFTTWPDADTYGHGTHCAGVIGARANQVGIVGVAPECRLYGAKVVGDDGRVKYEWLVRGIDWAAEQGVDIISISVTGEAYDAALEAACQRAYARGIFLCAAAGNRGFLYGVDTSGYPARFPCVLGVGAINPERRRAEFSSTGEGVDIVAPGTGVLSCLPGNRYGFADGTSTATPFAAGVMALVVGKLKAYGARYSGRMLMELVAQNAEDIGIEGLDPFTGRGILKPELMFSQVIRNLGVLPGR
ncbi:MAG TPA: S8 family peptidase [Candidatus Nitrosotenuis sp.]|jgi:subtilisin family serine protease|nr:S8 family peptidase [Candidatus Nitrosotenuis sp.]